MPNYEALSNMLIQALEARGRYVEYPWNLPGSPDGYMLSVFSPPEGGDPTWELTSGGPQGSRKNWIYATADVTLIQNMVECEVTGGNLEDAISDSVTSAAMELHTHGARDIHLPKHAGAYLAPQSLRSSLTGLPPIKQTTDVDATLEGDLENMQAPNLLQSINMSKMTGRLRIRGVGGGGAEIFFEDGSPVHAIALDAKGDLACMEVLMMETGKFRFYPNERTVEKTINKRLDAILMEGLTLLDHSKYLSKSGLTMESYLFRKKANLSEQEFEQAVSVGVPVPMPLQKYMYQQIDNQSTLFDILRRKPISKQDWMPVLFNLIKADLIVISEKPPMGMMKGVPLEVTGIDQEMMKGAMKAMGRPDTNIFTHSMFLYFAEQEFFRYERFGIPFSIIIFEMRYREAGGFGPLSLPMIAEAARRVNTVLNPLEVFCHFETFDYAIVMPHSNVDGALLVATRLFEMMVNPPLAANVHPNNMSISFGVSGIPEDCKDLGYLISAAREARRQAGASAIPVLPFRGLNFKQPP